MSIKRAASWGAPIIEGSSRILWLATAERSTKCGAGSDVFSLPQAQSRMQYTPTRRLT